MDQDSIQSYFMAWQFSHRYLSAGDGLTEQMHEIFTKAREKLRARMEAKQIVEVRIHKMRENYSKGREQNK